MTVAAVILAAGASTRFADGHKLLAEIDRVPMVRRVALAAAASRAEDIVVIVNERDGDVAAATGDGRWRFVENSDAASGLASSLQAGIAAVAHGAHGAAILLADMPRISAALIDSVIDGFERNSSRIVFPESADGRRGHPVIWPRTLFGELMALEGDRGAKDLLDRHAGLCLPIPTDDAGAFLDVDTRDDLVRLIKRSELPVSLGRGSG